MKTSGARITLGLAVLVGAAALVLWWAEPTSQGKAKEKASAAAERKSSAPPKLANQPSPPPAPAPPGAPVPRATSSPDAHPLSPAGQLAEASLMAQLRSARAEGNNKLAIKLAREGNKRFPDSSFAPERHAILIHALADNEQRSEARGEAEYMVNHFPDSDWVREIERFTGAHRHRNIRLNDAGEIEYY